MFRANILRFGNQLKRGRSSATIENLLENPAIDEEFANAKPYNEVPGPKPIPILGNTWRLLPVIGKYSSIQGNIT